MDQTLIISGTNRARSNTLKVCRIYAKLLREKGVASTVFDLAELPRDVAFLERGRNYPPEFEQILEKYVRPFKKMIFVVPEYNGSFPGILKVFLDVVHPSEWRDKQACLVGVADGRGGNIRGLEHLTGVLHYLQVHVFHNKLPISAITSHINEKGEFGDPAQLMACRRQLEGFLKM